MTLSRASHKQIRETVNLFFLGIGIAAAFLGWLLTHSIMIRQAELEAQVQQQRATTLEALLLQKSDMAPPVVKGIYLSSWTAGDKKRLGELIELVERTELNAVVIDIKDSRGTVAYETAVPLAQEHELAQPLIQDLPELLAGLKKRGVWAIARIPVFQDTVLAEARPNLAVKSKRTGRIWRDRKGLAWVDPASQEVWGYNADLSREALRLGFREVQFDYIRFPSDGDLTDLSYPIWRSSTPKYEVVESFFAHLKKELGERAILSVDLFGMTMLKANDPDDDLGIGQRLQDAITHFDYISPMVYPSHYPPGFEGFANPAARPYDVVAISMREGAPAFEGQPIRQAQGRRAKLRPWLQDFDLGAVYTAKMVRDQIRAADEHGGEGWLLWNAQNRYTEAALNLE